ncbi:MAG: hypothetical protein ACYDBP_09705 [Leptospirales bacterium]
MDHGSILRKRPMTAPDPTNWHFPDPSSEVGSSGNEVWSRSLTGDDGARDSLAGAGRDLLLKSLPAFGKTYAGPRGDDSGGMFFQFRPEGE